jgi:hypothetical protein
MGLDPKSFLDRDPKPDHGIVLQEPQDPDKFPNPGPFFFLPPLETTPKSVKALGQVQTHEGSGVIQRTRLSSQQRHHRTIAKLVFSDCSKYPSSSGKYLATR